MDYEKPPIGVSPYWYVQQRRIKDLKFWGVSMNGLFDVLTLQEAGKLWGKDDSTLRRVITDPKFVENVDYRKTGKSYLVTRVAMERVYGKIQDQDLKGFIGSSTKSKKSSTINKEFITSLENFKPRPYSEVNDILSKAALLTENQQEFSHPL